MTNARKTLVDFESVLPLRREPLCFLSTLELARLKQSCKAIVMPKGSKIYSQGEKADTIFFIIKGKVKTSQEGLSGRGQIVKMAAPMEFIGYRAALAGERHSASATTIDDSVLVSIPRADASDIVRRNPDMASYVIRSLARELGQTRLRSVSLTQKQIRGRLAESLLFLRDKYGYIAGSKRINILMTREDLASLSNMTTANAIRTLSAFADEGVLSVCGREITVNDEPMLEKISKLG